jgi:hypothetical protein
MSSSSANIPPRPASGESRAVRRERLLLLCAVDRARLRLLWRMPDNPKSGVRSLLGRLLGPAALATVLPWMPGRVGRWSRRVRAGVGFAGLLRGVLRAAS